MPQVFPDDGLNQWLDRMIVGNLLFGLFTNNVTITRSTTWASAALTEASWAGYSRVTVNSGWVVSVVGHLGFAIGTPIAFANSSGSTVSPYGYFVLDSTGTWLMAAAQFDGAPVAIADGDSYVMVPSLGDLSKALTSP
jgi:hypothetical protein